MPRHPLRAEPGHTMRAAVALAVAVTGVLACEGDDDRAAVTVVEVTAQPCTTPNRDRGLGVVVGDDLVATAAHTVEGPRREITVDGDPATVVAIDVRRDLALLAAPSGDAPEAALDETAPTEAMVVTPDGAAAVAVLRTGPLIVSNVSDDTRSERLVHTFEPGVAAGTSGAPLVTPDGAVAGIVLLDRGGVDRADAVTAGELAGLLAEHAAGVSGLVPDDPIGCLG